ncbi:hypothetical protein C1Y63_06165 [Corynebacterium sp. 13CS0277]|uniref:hypothetical protein n=1 Tax=Corynebacterium sp. 13CS0277 TaxID=2071994 RepID=UPI000D0415A9|nr:hypothetical protein [Corynebacterium sp. 13CS0277]PRQ11432.1 hypothetical protein C1Y63_06165 [Corynebacterium sp. 13CS0277]
MSTRDHRTARRLARAMHVARQRPRIVVVQRPYPAGPNLLTHMALGALVAEAVRHSLDYPDDDGEFFAAEFERRGLPETASVVRDGAEALGADEAGDAAEPLRVQQALTRLSAVGAADNILNGLAEALDLVDEDPWRDANPTMLTSNEQLDDLIIVGADYETVTAYANAVELSDISPSEDLADSLGGAAEVDAYDHEMLSEDADQATL